ncbi:MAG: DNA polymerase III subunit delta' [Gammaproteobacteria bacterium]
MNLEFPWLADPWSRVARALEADRMPAGLLILGRPGLGRMQFAYAVARARLCLQPLPDASACGKCASCRQADAGAHPDLLTVQPEEDKKLISVDQIRELTPALALTAGNQGARCAVIFPAECLTGAAANALLKTLEEPQAGVTVILVADSAHNLPATVISRCLRLPVSPPPAEQALDWLANRSQRADWPLLLALAGGAPLAAERLAEELGDDVANRLQTLIAAAARRADPIAVADGFSKWPLARFANLIGWLAYALLRTSAGDVAPDASWPRAIAAAAAHADARRLSFAWREANRQANDVVSLNPALARERLVLLFVNAFERRKARSTPA